MIKKLKSLFSKPAPEQDDDLASATAAPIETFTEQELKQNWPSIPNADMKVPTFKQIIDSQGENAKHVERLQEYYEKVFTKEDDHADFQVIAKSQFGNIAIPALVRRDTGDKIGYLVLYSHVGKWDDAAIRHFLDWCVKVRTTDMVYHLKIQICDSNENVPAKVREIASKRIEHLLVISTLPYIDKQGLKANAEVLCDSYGYFYKKGVKLIINRKCLKEIDRWILEDIGKIKEESFFFPYFLRLIGSYFGEVIIKSTGASWKKIEGSEWDAIQLPEDKISPAQKAKGFTGLVHVFAKVGTHLTNPKGTLDEFIEDIIQNPHGKV